MEEDKIIKEFTEVDDSDFPNFENYESPLCRGLWVLLVAKEKLGIKKTNSEQIALVIRDVKEYSCDAISITNAFCKAKDKIHTYKEDGAVYYEIMKPGKDYLLKDIKEGSMSLFYFSPDSKYTSKRIISTKIFSHLKGDLKIVDPYCDVRTLDLLKYFPGRKVQFITCLSKMKNQSHKNTFLRELQDFKTENSDVEFRDYLGDDIHDRYIISSDKLFIFGHSLKDLGGKESFCITIDKTICKDLVDTLRNTFNTRWSKSQIL